MSCLSLFVKTVLTIVSSALYVFDFFSDLVLGITYQTQGDTNWGIITLVFTFIPYLIQLIGFGLLWKKENDLETKLIFIASLFGLGPVASSIVALRGSFRDDDVAAQDYTFFSSFARGLIIIFEDFPQLCLQIYIVGRTNHASALQIAVIITSFISGGKGLLSLLADVRVSWGEKKELTIFKQVLYNLVMVPLIALMLISFIPTVALYSSLHPYNHAAHLSLLIYLIAHLFLVSLLLIYPNDKTDNSCTIFCGGLSSLIVQLIFFIVCNLLAARWLVSVAPLLPISQQNATASIPGVPSYVWPEPMPLLESWVYQFPNATENTTYPDWANLANCKLARENNSSFGMTNLKNSTIDGLDAVIDVTSQSLCVTDYSNVIFSIITTSSVILIAFHSIIVFVYPCLHAYVWEDLFR